MPRVHYNRRGQITGYSGGVGTYYWFAIMQAAGILLLATVVLIALAALAATAVLFLLAGGVVSVFASDRGTAIRRVPARLLGRVKSAVPGAAKRPN